MSRGKPSQGTVVQAGKCEEEKCFQAEAGLAFSLYGKQRGLTSLSEAQGSRGAFCDSCYNSYGLVGTARWEELKKELASVKEVQDEESTVRFGGGAARSVGMFEGVLKIGDVTASIRIVVIRGQLPFLLGEAALAKFGILLDCAERTVWQRNRALAHWKPGAMPMVDVRGACSSSGARECRSAFVAEEVQEAARSKEELSCKKEESGVEEVVRKAEAEEEQIEQDLKFAEELAAGEAAEQEKSETESESGDRAFAEKLAADEAAEPKEVESQAEDGWKSSSKTFRSKAFTI